jgi:DNA-binding XRE family transcriptional regulator
MLTSLGLSQRQAAEVIGCHSTALLHWEKGSAEPELRLGQWVRRLPLALVQSAVNALTYN